MSEHDGHRNRMRQRILHDGLESLAPHEVLEYFLFAFVPRRNTNDIAHRLLQRFGSLSGVLSADYEALLQVEGVTANAALFLSSVPTLAVMYKRDLVRSRPEPVSPQEGIAYLNSRIGTLPYEAFAALCCDSRGNRLGCLQYTMEQRDFVAVNMRKFVRDVLLTRATNVLVAHNHPSGDLTPSHQDYTMYEALQAALLPLGITVVDCVIVSGDDYVSLEARRAGAYDTLMCAETPVGMRVATEEADEYDLLFNRDNAPKRK